LTKQAFSSDKIIEINDKREETNLKKYGVKNSGQTKEAKLAHKEFYSISENVKGQTLKFEETLVNRYGVSNPRKIKAVNDKIKNTLMSKYGVDNPQKDEEIKNKAITTRRNKKEEISKNALMLSYARLAKEFSELFNVTFESDEYKGVVGEKYTFKCNICSTEFISSINLGIRPICKVCNPTPTVFKSAAELEILDCVKSMGINVISGDRSKINPYELDIWVPSKNIAIEYCGLYWHGETSGKPKDYHLMKYLKCKEKGIRLITVFEDEWVNKKEICKARLRHIFGKNEGIGARKLTISAISNKDAFKFFETHHIQGGINSDISVGAYLNNELVAAMSFGRPRIALGRKTGAIELLRFSTDGGSYPGVANRLFKRAVKDNNINEVISYCDLRWGTGNLYESLGFSYEYTTKPNYWYFKLSDTFPKRYHRFGFTKKSLVAKGADALKTEQEIMKELNYIRIWDCGNLKFTWKTQ
jgi:hypothetical protein